MPLLQLLNQPGVVLLLLPLLPCLILRKGPGVGYSKLAIRGSYKRLLTAQADGEFINQPWLMQLQGRVYPSS
jgi:hypothetical protein